MIHCSKPGPPGTPKVTEVGGDFVNLQWEKPESDGGSRVKGYWVEKREVGSNLWQYVNQFIQAATQINITNLIEGRQYEFRVFAENEAGVGEPSSNSSSVIVKVQKLGISSTKVSISVLSIVSHD